MEKTTKKVRPKSVAVRPKKEATAARKSTFAIIFVLQKGKAREDGTAPIVAHITVNHEMVHFATRMYIHPDRWLPKDYRTASKSREEKQINDALDERFSDANGLFAAVTAHALVTGISDKKCRTASDYGISLAHRRIADVKGRVLQLSLSGETVYS